MLEGLKVNENRIGYGGIRKSGHARRDIVEQNAGWDSLGVGE